MRHFNQTDQLLTVAGSAFRTLWGRPHAQRPRPTAPMQASQLSPAQRKLSGALMRVNHVGEVCAQALYQAQALTARHQPLKTQFEKAAQEEEDHLAWTQSRLEELRSHASWLNPAWYAGAFGLGWLAGQAGDRISLGFVAETERQVEAHLHSHLDRLPGNDLASRAIVQQMKEDEARHAHNAEQSGAATLPLPVRWMMRAAAKLMTVTAHRI